MCLFNIWMFIEVAIAIFLLPKILRGQKFCFYSRDRLYLAPAAIGMIAGGLQMAIGAVQKIKAAKMAKHNIRPLLKDNPYTEDMYNLTGSYANEGLSESSKQAYLGNNDRNLSSSIEAMLKLGGNPNLISDMYSSSQGGIRELAVAEQQAKNNNINRFIQSGLIPKASQERDKFFLNEMVPFQDKAALISSLSNQGMDNIFKGFNTGASAGIQGMMGDMYKSDPVTPDGGDFGNLAGRLTTPQSTIPLGRRRALQSTLGGNVFTANDAYPDWMGEFDGPWNHE